MLTYICPDCDATVSAADGECPKCAANRGVHDDETAALDAPAVTNAWRDPGRARTAPAEVLPPASSKSDPAPARTPKSPTRRRGGLEVRPWYYGVLAAGLAVAIVAAVALSGGFRGLRFEDPAAEELSRVGAFEIGVHGPIEVSGIRPYYDDEYQAHVRAFVANHSSEEQSVALAALMRVREAGESSLPLATFEVVISNPLPAKEGVEVDVPLRAMGTLQSLPPWNEIRVDLEVLGARPD